MLGERGMEDGVGLERQRREKENGICVREKEKGDLD